MGANRDGGAGRCPAPGVSVASFLEGSGRAGGRCRVGGAEWIDRWFADEEAQDLADLISFQS